MVLPFYQGPLGSETLNGAYLLAGWVDTGDFGVGKGYNRLVSPEYKLRHWQQLSTFHGMGLMYRFYEFPPFKDFCSMRRPWQTDRTLQDAYRCVEVLFGNGGYLFLPEVCWEYRITECLLVGILQRYYTLEKVARVLYQSGQQWLTLEQLVQSGLVVQTSPWEEQTRELGRIRVEYDNGLIVVANRLQEPLDVETGKGCLTLPKDGWVAWQKDVLAYSAYFPGSEHRVDYIEDARLGIRYLAPRGETVLGVDHISLWKDDQLVMSADPEAGWVYLNGEQLPIR